MNKFLLLILFMFFKVSQVLSGTIYLDGNYQGSNLIIQNPFSSSGVGFCVFEVLVNGEISTDEINSSAFEIDFSQFGLKFGSKIEIEIKHKEDCKPKILNPEVLKPESTYQLESINVDKDGVLTWRTSNETGVLPYRIEQYRWNKWVYVGEVDGKGTPNPQEYKFKIESHSGENRFRVKQVDFTGKPRYSKDTKFMSMKKEVTFGPDKPKDEIVFSDETLFEIYDAYGNIAKKGYGKKVMINNLAKGVYYLNYDNKSGEFTKK
jgi:hypothetical protein